MKAKLVLAVLSICVLGTFATQEASAARKVKLWCAGASGSLGITLNYSICTNRATGERYRIGNFGVGLIAGWSAGIDYIEIKTACRSIEGQLYGGGLQWVKGIGAKAEVYGNRCMRAAVVGARVGYETGISLKGMWISKVRAEQDDYEESPGRFRYARSEDDAPRRRPVRYQEEPRADFGMSDSYGGLK